MARVTGVTNMDDFSIEFEVDEPNRILKVTASGKMQSAVFVDRCIAFFSDVPQPWQYHCLYDETGCSGVVAFADLDRMSIAVNRLWSNTKDKVRVAVVNPNPLVAARLPMVGQMYANPNHRSFDSLANAMEWLTSPPGNPA